MFHTYIAFTELRFLSTTGRLGPGFFPRIIGVGLIAVCLLGLYLGNMALLAINIFAIPLFVWLVRIPYRVLAPAVVVVCTNGTYSVNGSITETWLMFVAGLVGFFMRLFGYSPGALVLALVLGPLAEESLRQTLTISCGSFGSF